MQLAHIELLMTYSVKDILSLVRRDARFDTKLVNDLFFEGTFIDENSHHFVFDNLVQWLYDRV